MDYSVTHYLLGDKMNVILTHVGSNIQSYSKYGWHQLRVFNPNIDIYFIGQSQSLLDNKDDLRKYNIIPIEAEQFNNNQLIKEFRRLQWYDAWGSPNTVFPSPKNFVTGTSLRLYTLNAFLEQANLIDSIHLENDIMIFADLYNLMVKIKNIYNKFTCTEIQDHYSCCGFTYIPHQKHLNDVCVFMLKLLELGDSGIKNKYKFIPMVHEMLLISLWEDKMLFPILPTDQYYEELGCLVDGCSVGQFLGGTNCFGQGEGYVSSEHFVGRKIMDGTYKPVILEKLPYLVDKEGKLHKLANLHIHSKKLENFC